MACELTCIVPNKRISENIQTVLSGANIIAANTETLPRRNMQSRFADQSYWIRKAIAYFGYDRHLMAAMLKRVSRYDTVLGFDLPSVAYLMAVAEHGSQKNQLRIICDLIDDPHLTWSSLPINKRLTPTGMKNAISIGALRRSALKRFDAVTAVAPRDAESLSRVAGREVAVIPNGVVADETPGSNGEREAMVIFTGAMNFPPNEDAACYMVHRIWPQVLKHINTDHANISDVKLAIVGANPTSKVKKLAHHPGIMVTGRVEDLKARLRQARVAVAPMISGCGMKNKVLEAASVGCPVVTTSLGAAGLPTGQSQGILVADRPVDFGREVARLLLDPNWATAIGRAGWTMVSTRFSWTNSAEKLLGVLTGKNIQMTKSTALSWALSEERITTKTQDNNAEAMIHAAS